MSIKCLMIETSDKKRLFTNIGSRRQLEEFCKVLNAKMCVVKANLKRSQLMGLQRLIVALCEKPGRSENTEFEVLKSKKTVKTRNRNRRL